MPHCPVALTRQSKQRAALHTETIARIAGNLNNPSSCNATEQRAKGNSTTTSVKHNEHKAASWKLHMGWILGQAKSGSSNSKDGPEFEKRKRNKTKPKGSREACVFSLMKPFPGLAAGTDRTAVSFGSAYKFLMFSATPAVYCGSV